MYHDNIPEGLDGTAGLHASVSVLSRFDPLGVISHREDFLYM